MEMEMEMETETEMEKEMEMEIEMEWKWKCKLTRSAVVARDWQIYGAMAINSVHVIARKTIL